jgi:hypothetical protein
VKNLILAMLVTAVAGQVASAATIVVVDINALPLTRESVTTSAQNGAHDGAAGATIGGVATVELACDFFTGSTVVAPVVDYSVGTDAPLSGVNFTSDAGAAANSVNALNAVTGETPAAQNVSDEEARMVFTPTAAYITEEEVVAASAPVTNFGPSRGVLMAGLGLLLCAPLALAHLRNTVVLGN